MGYLQKPGMTLRHIVNLPFIWVVIIPLAFLDLFTEIYHQIGFRLCGIPLVKRSSYIKIDRHKLKYLNWSQKLGCAYCGYANGFAGYFTEIGARTEKYWCAIRHKQDPEFIEPAHHGTFAEYDDEEDFKLKFRN